MNLSKLFFFKLEIKPAAKAKPEQTCDVFIYLFIYLFIYRNLTKLSYNFREYVVEYSLFKIFIYDDYYYYYYYFAFVRISPQ